MKLLAFIAVIIALAVAAAPAFALGLHGVKEPPKKCGVYYKYNC